MRNSGSLRRRLPKRLGSYSERLAIIEPNRRGSALVSGPTFFFGFGILSRNLSLRTNHYGAVFPVFKMAKKKKYYVVWAGHRPGVYDTWADCQQQVHGFPEARYKSFPSLDQAEAAFQESHGRHIGQGGGSGSSKAPTPRRTLDELETMGVDMRAICVDAACSGNPGDLEYQGVTITGDPIFHRGPFAQGTVNLGEFLAIVSALAWLKNRGDSQRRVYSDSRTGMAWVRKRQIKTTLPRTAVNEPLFQRVDRAIQWLQEHSFSNPVTKWETERWGEIPADFGRK